MIKTIVTIAGAVTALCGIITIIYKMYLSPAAKKKRRVLKAGKNAVDAGDVSGITSAFDKLRIVLVLVLLSCGCASKVTLHPIDQTDIIRVKQDETLTAPKDGYFLSDMYVKSVMEAKVK